MATTNEAASESHIQDALITDGYRLGEPRNFDSEFSVEKLIQDAFGRNRKHELELYRKHASDPDFQRAFDNCIVQILEKGLYEIIGAYTDLGGAAAEKGA